MYRYAYKGTISLQNTKYIGPGKKLLLLYNNKNTKYTEQRILKEARGKGQVTYKGRPTRITSDFSSETLKARRAWAELADS